MWKLIQYELRKTWITKAILLAVTAVAEAVFLIGLYGNQNNAAGTGALVLFLLAIFGIMIIGLESVLVLHRDMNTRQGYMLFMTPNSCYRILGAKVIECSASILLSGAFFFALGALDITLLFGHEGRLGALWEEIQRFLANIQINGTSLRIDAQLLSSVAFSLLSGWICLITSAYLADVISAALLNGKKYNGLISFGIFLVLNWAVSYLSGLAVSPIKDAITSLCVSALIELAIAAGMYYLTAHIMEKYLSV